MPLLRDIFFLHAERRSSHRACIHLLRCLQLREKREELNKSIAADEEEKGTHAPPLQLRCFYSADGTLTVYCRHRAPAAKIQNDLRILTERLARINDNLARKVSSHTEYDKTITEVRSTLLLLRHVVILRQLPLTCCCFCCYACVLHRRRPPQLGYIPGAAILPVFLVPLAACRYWC